MKNVAAVGNACGFVEPIEATALHVIIRTIGCITDPLVHMDRHLDDALIEVANQEVSERWDDVRDFIALHYRLNRRGSNAFWESCRRDIELGMGKELLEVYRRCGPTPLLSRLIRRSSIFGCEGYLALLLGMRAPTDYRFQPSAGDESGWRRYLHDLERATAPFLSMDEALRIVTRPDWRWPAETRIAWSPDLAQQ